MPQTPSRSEHPARLGPHKVHGKPGKPGRAGPRGRLPELTRLVSQVSSTPIERDLADDSENDSSIELYKDLKRAASSSR